MSNVFKANFIQFSAENTKVIDSNSLVAKRLEGFSGVLREAPAEKDEISLGGAPNDALEAEDGFNPLAMAELLADRDDGDNCSFEEGLQETAEDVARMKEEALEEIEQIKAAAREEIDEIKNDARKEGYEAGYAEGLDAAKAEYEERCNELENQRNGLEEEYQTLVSELEPKIVDVITDVYTHVFGDSFFNHRDVMVSLISKALSGASADDNVVIHVSSEDYDMLLGMKQQLFSRVSLMREPEIISEDRLKAGEAKVETAYGIMDCGIDTELKELSRILHVLSYEGHDQC